VLRRPSAALKKRVAAIVAARKDANRVAVPSPAEHPRFELSAVLEALRDGRPYSHLPVGHPVELLETPLSHTEPIDDPSSPAAGCLRQLEDLRNKMAADPEPIDFDAIRRDTIRQIERENGDTARRDRQREKRKRKAERRRTEKESHAAILPAVDSSLIPLA
jgi:hypothetical protein